MKKIIIIALLLISSYLRPAAMEIDQTVKKAALADYHTRPFQLKRTITANNGLVKAIQKNSLKGVQEALSKNADINEENGFGGTPAMLSLRISNIDIVKYILDNANPDLLKQDYLNATIFHHAVASQKPENVAILVDYAFKKSKKFINYFLFIKSYSGWTPLIQAGYQGSFEIVRMLIDLCRVTELSNGDKEYLINLRDKKGRSALDFAIEFSTNTSVPAQKREEYLKIAEFIKLELKKTQITWHANPRS